jgi:hypothetical protein
MIFVGVCVYIVTCYDTGVRCLQVLLTPTCRVSGYPRQVIKVEMLLDDDALFAQRYRQL